MNTLYPVDPKVDVVELLQHYISISPEGERFLDFNKIVGPMPESLYCHCTPYPKVSFGD